jgi:hypothetical protein
MFPCVLSVPPISFLSVQVLHQNLPDVVVGIPEGPGSDLCPETGYLFSGFSWFSSVQENAGIVSFLKLGHYHEFFLLHPFQFIIN